MESNKILVSDSSFLECVDEIETLINNTLNVWNKQREL